MNMLRGDIKKVICLLFSNLDFYFEKNGFKRRKSGLIYVHKIGETVQKIEIVFFSNPSYYRGVIAHIYPHIQIYFPKINNTAQAFANHLIPQNWINKFTIRQPIQVYSKSKDFLLKNSQHYEPLENEILSFFEEYTMPLLDNLTRDKDYLTLYESNDKRIVWDDYQYLYIASAYVNECKFKEAYQIIENRFNKPGLQEKYKEVFSFFEHIDNI